MTKVHALLATALLVTCLAGFPAPQDKVVFLDVGQGDAILLQQGTQQVLIDGGEGTAVLTRLGEEMPYFDRRVEVMIVTHPDRDHLEGLVHVLDRYEVGMVLLPNAPHTSQLQEGWLAKLSESGVPFRFAWAQQKLMVGDIQIQILGPLNDANAQAAAQKAVNNASVLTRVDYRDLSLLLTGDAEQIVEHALVQHVSAEILDVDILKAGHHGSKTSTSSQLLAAASPRAVVISLGEGNRFGHPHPNVMQRLAPYPVLRTDEHGSVRFLHLDGRWRLALDK